MRRVLLFSAFVLFFTANAKAQVSQPAVKTPASQPAAVASASPAALQAARASFAKLPLSFEENVGQTDGRVKFSSRGAGYNLFLTADEAVFALRGGSAFSNCAGLAEKFHPDCSDSSKNKPEESVLWLKMLGANVSAPVAGTEPLPGKINYYIGNDPAKWRTGVRQFGRVNYRGIYPGVDLTYYGNQQQLESDFVVAPGADPRLIQFEVKGARETRIDAQGNLILVTNVGNVQLLRPGIYQEIKGVRHDVSGHYLLRSKNRVAFAIGAYDRHEKLIIDPTLVYATYLGGSGGDGAQAIAVDTVGRAYVAGQGASFDFPGSDLNGPPNQSLTNFAFVTVLSANGSSGTQLVYSTILAGSLTDFETTMANGIGVDSTGNAGSAGNAYVAGVTGSSNFPMVNPFQSTFGGALQTGFVAGLKSDGTLSYSTYLGGRNGPGGGQGDSTILQGLFANSTGNAYVVGSTTSENFPTVNPLPYTLTVAVPNAFPPETNVVVAKLNPQGQPLYSTYLSGAGSDDLGTAIVADAAGNAYVTGQTVSTAFPIHPIQASPTPFQNALNGTAADVFVTKLSFSGSALSVAGGTFLGGSSSDEGMAITVDTATPLPNVYVTGQTLSSGTGTSAFPTKGPIGGPGTYSGVANAGGTDVFVTKISGDFTTLMYSTYLGGIGTDIGYGIALDGASPPNAYVTGSTSSLNFPLVNTLQAALGSVTATNAFVAEINGAGSALTYSTYLGGFTGDVAHGIALDSAANAYIAGKTASANFPVVTGGAAGTSPFQGQLGSSQGNAFVAKISPTAPLAALNFFPPSYNFHTVGLGGSIGFATETVTLTNNSAVSVSGITFTVGGTNPGDFSVQSAAAPCSSTAPFTLAAAPAANSSCTIVIRFTPTDQDTRSGQISINSTPASSTVLNLTGTGGVPEVSFSPATVNFFPSPDPLNFQAVASVTVTNSGGGPLIIGSAQIQAADAANLAPFSIGSGCVGSTIDPGRSCGIEIFFVPTVAGSFSATLLLNTNAAGSPQTFSFSGTSVAEVLVQPKSLEFGLQVVNSTSTNNLNEFGVLNGSGVPITLTLTPGASASQGDFHIDNSLGLTTCANNMILAPGQICTTFLYFQPTAVSATDGRTGNYTVGYTGTAVPSVVPGSQVVNLMGTGVTGIFLLTNPINFGNEFVGFTLGSPLPEALYNGTSNLITVNVTMAGNNPGDFTAPLDSTCAPGGVVPALTYCRVSPTFTPSALGLRSATASFHYTGDLGVPLLLNLSGTGIPGPVIITANGIQTTSFDFGSEIISTTTPEMKFVVHNEATAQLSIQSISVPGNTDFKITPDSTCVGGGTVPAGGNCFIGVTYTPSTNDKTKKTTTFILTDAYTSTGGADSSSPHTLTISGTGEPAVITVSVSTTVSGASQTLLDLGNVPVNPASLSLAIPQAEVFLTNAGNTPTTITWTGGSPVLNTASTAFSIVASGTNPTTCTQNRVVVAQGGNCQITVQFNPTTSGEQTNSVTFTDSVGGSHTVQIQGNGVGRGLLSLSAATPVTTFSSLSFNQLVNTTSSAQSVTVYNLGNGSLTITSVPIFGTNASNFNILPSSTCIVGAVLVSGSTGNSCVFNITFTAPGTAGFTSAELEVQANLGNNTTGTVFISLSGTAAVGGISISPASPINFGAVAVGSTSSNNLTLTNNFPTSVTLGTITLPAGYSFPFDPCSGTVLAASSSCFLSVNFSPTSATAAFNGNISVPFSGTGVTGSPFTAALQGTGSTAVVANPNPMVFQFATINNTLSIFATLTNGSASPATITGISSPTGANAADFTIPGGSNFCPNPTVLAATNGTTPGGQCFFTVNFLSSTAGDFSAQFTVSYSIGGAPQTPITVPVSASIAAAQITISPNPLIFPPQTVNTQSQSMSITISNSASATAALQITSLQINGNDFAIGTSGSNCFFVTAGQSCTIPITFTPSQASGTNGRTGTLTITDNAATTTQVIPLQGTGVAGSVSASPTVLTFPTTNVGSSVTAGVILSNSTGSPVAFTGVTYTGPYSTDTTGVNACSTLNPVGAVTGTCVVYIKFSPSGVTNAGTATIHYGATGTIVITLSGPGSNPIISVSPTSLTFTAQTVGTQSSPQSTTLSNPTSAAVSVSGTPAISGTNASDFILGTNTCTSGTNLPATTGSCVVNVIFKPGSAGGTGRTASLSISDTPNDAGSPHFVALSGTAIQPDASLGAATMSFGSVNLVVTSGQQVVTLTNTGNAGLTISTVVLGGTNSGDFALGTPSIGTDCRTVGTLAANASCNVAATFTPVATGSRTATITITDNATPATQVITLSGNGTQPVVTLNPTTIQFGNQRLNTQSPQSTSTLTNSGTGTLTITGLTLTGTNPGDFALVVPASGTDCRTIGTVGAGATCVIAVTFTPGALGSRSATVSVADSASGSPHMLPLTGTGVFPQVTPTPSPLPFGNQMENLPSAVQTLTLTNGGTGTLNLATVALGGTNANQFAIVTTGTTCTNGSTVLAGANCVVKLTFTPTALGAQTATITFTDDASPTTQVVTLTGTGVFPQATPTPSPLPFGNQRENTTSAPLTVTLTNGGTGTLTLTTVALAGTNVSEFAIATGTTCTNASTVLAGANCVVKLTFTPTALGIQTATLTFTDNASPTTQVVTLTGTGIAPSVQVAGTLPFGNQPINQTATLALTVTNNGTDTLNLAATNAVAITAGTNSTLFGIGGGTTCTNGLAIVAQGSCTINVTFQPTVVGTFGPVTLVITDDSGAVAGTKQSVALSGSGVTATMNFGPSPVNFTPNQNVGTTSGNVTVTLTNSGGLAVQLAATNAVAISGTNASDFAIVATGTTCMNNAAVGGSGGSCAVILTFTPSGVGARTATLTVTDSANPTTQTVTLNGTGIAPVASVPTTQAFGNQLVSVRSGQQTVTLSNTGTAALTIGSVALSGSNAGDFAIVSGAGTTCVANATVGFTAPNNTCTVALTFTPAAAGARVAVLTFTDNSNDAAGSTQTVNLSGTGQASPTATLSTTSVPFGNQRVGTTSAATVVTITNNGDAALALASIVLDASGNPTDFALTAGATTPCPLTGGNVSGHASCTFNVAFKPTAASARTATVDITDNGNATGTAGTKQTVGLTGTGIAPSVQVAGTLPFGNQPINQTATLALTVTNNGTDTLNLAAANAVAITAGTNSTLFGMGGGTTCTNGLAIVAQGSCTINVTFQPTVVGTFGPVTLVITDDSGAVAGTKQSVALSGSGVTATMNFGPSPVNFTPNQNVGTTSGNVTVTLTNSGGLAVQLAATNAVAISGTNASDFAIVATGTTCMNNAAVGGSGGSCAVILTFTPSGVGARTATLTVTDSANPTTQTVTLNGTGIAPVASVPTTQAFGNQLVSVRSGQQTVTLSNTGTAALTIGSVALSGSNAGDFAIVSGAGTTCVANATVGFTAPNNTCTVALTFTPAAAGARVAVLTFTDNSNDAAGSTQTVNLSGTGQASPTATLSTTSVPFGNQRVGTTSAATVVTITNNGDAALALASIVLDASGNPTDFALTAGATTPCPLTGGNVSGHASCTFNVAFKPTAASARTATVDITDNGNATGTAGTKQTVGLTGTGIAPSVQVAGTLPFGNQPINQTATLALTVTNNGTDTLNLAAANAVAITAGTNSTLFGMGGGTTCTNGLAIVAQGSCTINVTFQPTVVGTFGPVTLVITDDSGAVAGTKQSVALSGSGVTSTVNFNPATVPFGNQRVGVQSAQMTSVLTNSATTTLPITGVSITGTNLGDFALAAPSGVGVSDCRTVGTVAAGGTCTIAVTFTPTAPGSKTATVSVSDNAAGSPHTFTLTGSGTAPTVSLNSSTVTFPNQIQLTPSPAQTVTLTNTGTAVLNLSTVVLGGTNPADFAIVSGTGTTCVANATIGFTAPNNTCTVAVTFNPATANPFSATLTFTDDASPLTQVVNLSGTGVTPPTATPSLLSLTFVSQPTSTTSAAQTVTLTNSGGAALSIASITLTGANPGDFAFASPATTCPTGASGGQVAAGSNCVLGITFDPTAIGARAASITIVVTGIANPTPITLTGTGTAPDLAIAKSHAGSFEVGVNGTYSIKLTNNGTAATQHQITVTDTLPGGLGFVSGAGTGWTCNANAQVVTCTNPGPVNTGASSTVTLTVSVASAAFPSVTNSATVSDTGDSGTTDKSSTDAPTVVTAPEVTISNSHGVDFTVGSNGVYTIKVTNNGTGATTGNITVTDTLPAGLAFVSNTGAGWACTSGAQNAQVVTCTYTGAALAAAGGSSTLMLTVSVAPNAITSPTNFSVTNTATVADPNDGKSNDKTATDVPTNIDNAVPTQSSISPSLGLIAGATSAQQLTLTGTGFNSSTQVIFGSNPVLTGTANAAGTSLTITVPVADLALANAGNVTIGVTNPKNPISNAGGGAASTNPTFPLVGMQSITPHAGTPNPVPIVAGTPTVLQVDLNLTPAGAMLPADVTITCSFPSALTGATCSPSPATIAHGTAAANATTMITMNGVPAPAGGSSKSAPRMDGRGPWSTYLLWLIATVLLSMLGMLSAVRQRALPLRRAPAYLTLALLVLAAGALVGCTKAAGTTPTPTGPSTITVTATTADGATVSTTVNITISN